VSFSAANFWKRKKPEAIPQFLLRIAARSRSNPAILETQVIDYQLYSEKQKRGRNFGVHFRNHRKAEKGPQSSRSYSAVIPQLSRNSPAIPEAG
jgi:hypothetical protein